MNLAFKMGYPVEWFVEPIPSYLICESCKQVARDPLKCHNCHLFCKSCFDQVIKTKLTCPVCEDPMFEQMIEVTASILSYVGKLSVKCGCNSKNICGWSGLFEELDGRLSCFCDQYKAKYSQYLDDSCDQNLALIEQDLIQHNQRVASKYVGF